MGEQVTCGFCSGYQVIPTAHYEGGQLEILPEENCPSCGGGGLTARGVVNGHAAIERGRATPTFDLPGTANELAIDPDFKFRENAVNNNATELLHKLKRVGRTLSREDFFADLSELEQRERDYEKKFGKKSS